SPVAPAECQQLSSANLPRARKTDDLSNSAQNGDERTASIIHAHLIQTGLLEIHCAVGGCHFEQLSRRKRAYVEYSGAVTQCQLSTPLGQREHIHRRPRIQ